MARAFQLNGPWALAGLAAAGALGAVAFVIAAGSLGVFGPEPVTEDTVEAGATASAVETVAEEAPDSQEGPDFQETPEEPIEETASGRDAPVDVAAAPDTAVLATAPATPAPATPAAEETTESAALTPVQPETSPEDETLAAPSFDLVRAEADGSVLVAGRGPLGYIIEITLDGAQEAAVPVDGTGAFVHFLSLDASPEARVLALLARGPEGEELRGEAEVILAPTLRPDPQPQLAEAQASATAALTDREEAPGALSEPADRPQGPPTETAEAAATASADAAPDAGEVALAGRAPEGEVVEALAEPAARPVETPGIAPAVLLAGSEGVRLLQPADSRAERLDRVVIDVISYDAEGQVTLEGRGAAPPPPVDRVRIYLDNAFVVTTRIADDGTWRIPLSDVESGVYTLRVDQLDAEGTVVSRFETPFKRESEEALAELQPTEGGAEGLQASVITVQPGFTLWGIASERYGDGFRYVQIFEANDDRIRDPDLIYPGQIFDLPKLEEN